MNRPLRLRASMSVAFAIALGVSAGAVPAPARAGSHAFGPLTLTNLAGGRVSLRKLHGKVVVLNFWATWCKPCVEELPVLADLAKRYSERGLVVVAASIDEPAARVDVARIAGAMPEGVQVWIGATISDMQRLEMGAGVPVTVLLDREGSAVDRHSGPLARGSMDREIEDLLRGEDAPKKVPGVDQAGPVPDPPQAAGLSL